MPDDWKQLLDYGIPLALLMALAGALWVGWWRLCNWLKPHIEKIVSEQISAWRKVADSCERTHLYEAKQTDDLHAIRIDTEGIARRQQDRSGITSNVHTHEKLERLLDNDTHLAHAARLALETIASHHPEVRDDLSRAIETLKKVEE